jgi:glycosyltransferase involved in cell wall biosynthesis
VSANVLLLSSGPPDPAAIGGVELHVAALSRHVGPDVRVHTAFVHAGDLCVASGTGGRPIATIPVSGGRDDRSRSLETAIAVALAGTEAALLHVHSPMLGPEAIAAAAKRAGARVVVTLHDHALVCENHELLEQGVRYCGIPEAPARCDACLRKTRPRSPRTVRDWRARMQSLVQVTDTFVAPSASVLEHVARVHPDVRARARRIDWGVPEPRVRVRHSARAPGPLSIAVVCAWATVKGKERLPELLAACSGTDVVWHFFGATQGASLRHVERSAPRVVLHGAYHREALAERLDRAGCHLALLPSVGSETFSLTLSEIAAAGLPVIASDLGALGERVRRERLGFTFDPWNATELAGLVNRLTWERDLVDEVAAHVRALPVRSEAEMAEDHAELYRELARKPSPTPTDDSETLRARFAEGERAARALRGSRTWQALEAFRKTDFYRDLPLRRVLGEETRAKIEERFGKLFTRGRRD